MSSVARATTSPSSRRARSGFSGVCASASSAAVQWATASCAAWRSSAAAAASSWKWSARSVGAPAREVHRELGGMLAGPRAEAGLLAPPDRAMQAHAPRRRDALVEHPPVQRVPEAVAAGHRSVRPFRDAGVDDERPLRRELLARRPRSAPASACKRRRDGGDGELVSRHARRLEHLADRRRQAVHAAADQLLQAGSESDPSPCRSIRRRATGRRARRAVPPATRSFTMLTMNSAFPSVRS